MRIRRGAGGLALACAMGLGQGPAQASIGPLYEEALQGDLNGSQLLALDRSGFVQGWLGGAFEGTGLVGSDTDEFRLRLAPGLQLNRITVDYDGSATVGNVRSVVSFQLQAAAADAHVQTATGFGPGAVSLFAADGLLPLGAASLPNREFVFLLTYQSAGYTFGQAPVGPVGPVGLNYSYTLTFEVAPAPLPNVAEPPSGLLAALGLAALGRWRRLRPLRAA